MFANLRLKQEKFLEIQRVSDVNETSGRRMPVRLKIPLLDFSISSLYSDQLTKRLDF